MAKKIIPEKEPTIIETVQKLLKEHIEITKAIVTDYIGGPSMEEELAIAYGNLQVEIEDLEEEPSFEKIFQQLETLPEKELDFDKLISLFKGADFDFNELLKVIDDEDIYDYVASKGYIYVKVNNLRDTIKIEDFLKTEIYPHLSDQNANILI